MPEHTISTTTVNTNRMSPGYCDAFQDHQHRYALDSGERWSCGCGRNVRNADQADVLTVNENTDFTALAFMLGYDVQDYPMYLWPEEDRIAETAVARTIPPHTHTWVDDGRYTDTGDVREICTGCPAIRSLTPSQQREDGL